MINQLMNVAETIGTSVLWILIGLSVVSMGIAIERFFWFTARKVDATTLGRQLVAKLAAHDMDSARKLLDDKSVEAAVMKEALLWTDRGTDSVREVIEGTLREKKKEYERGLLYLGTLGNNAPFVGLFGTVLGIVSAFKELGNAGQNNGQMGNVMGGIAEALIATAVGILVAIPAVVAFNYFQKRAGEVEENVATLTNYLFAHMKSTGPMKAHLGNGAVATDTERPVATASTNA